MKQIFKLLFALTLLFGAALSAAATIYVRTTGDDANDGSTPALAMLTIAAAHTVASDGDVIDIGAGLYDQGSSGLTISKNVTLRGPYATTTGYGPTRYALTAAGNAGEAVLTGGGSTASTTIGVTGTAVTIEGLTVTNSTGPFIAVNVGGTGTLTLRYNRFPMGLNRGLRHNSGVITYAVAYNHCFGYTPGGFNLTIFDLSDSASGSLFEYNLLELGNYVAGDVVFRSSTRPNPGLTIRYNVFGDGFLSPIFLGNTALSNRSNINIYSNDFLGSRDGGVPAISLKSTNLSNGSVTYNKFSNISAPVFLGLLGGGNVSTFTYQYNLNLTAGSNSFIENQNPGTADATNNVWGPNAPYGPGGGNSTFGCNGVCGGVTTSPNLTTCITDAVATSYTDATIIGAGFQPDAPPTGVTATVSPTSICSGGTLTLAGAATGATSFSWTGPGTITSASSQNTTATNVTSGGTYTFTATSSASCAATATTGSVTVNTIPTAPVAVSATTGSQTSVTVTWNVVAGVTQYRVGYRVNGATNYIFTGLITGTGSGSTRTYAVTGLQAGTNYQFIVQAYSPACGAYSANSNIVSATTNAPILQACYTPISLYGDATGGGNATIGYRVPTGNYSCVVLAYGPINVSPNGWATLTIPAGGSPNAAKTYFLSGLTAGTVYGFRMRTNCTQCNNVTGTFSNWSAVQNFTASRDGASESFERFNNIAPSLSVYPNPSRGMFTVRAENFPQNETSIQIYDMTGKMVYQNNALLDGETNIDLSDQPDGVYLIKAGEKSLKIIKE